MRIVSDTTLKRKSGVAVTTRITLEGEFFRDPGKSLRSNVRDMLDKLSDEMQAGVRADIHAHASEMPNFTGWTASNVFGYTTSFKTGKRWGTWAAVAAVTSGMDKKDAIRTKAAAASIERRFHPWRKVKSAVYRSRALISADLTKGMG